MSVVAAARAPDSIGAGRRSGSWWPLGALLVLAAALRLSTLDLQGFWYDEAFTPVHVLHSGLSATLRSVVHTENTPPLWYVVEWLDSRVLGTGEVALRLPSALAGVATVAVMWAIGGELSGRRAAVIAAALVSVNPLFVWYSQEARAYSLFVLTSALAMLCFLRAERVPTPRRMAAFAFAGALALLTHYFAVFLLAPMVIWLLCRPSLRRSAAPAICVLALVGLALVPLISAQGGHGTQWIGRWALSSRLQAIPQYFLTGYSGAPLGHGVELAVGLLVLAGAGLGLWCLLDRAHSPAWTSGSRANRPRGALRGAQIALAIAASSVLVPIVLAALGADYLAPRNLVGAMIPVTALIAVLLAATDRRDRSGRAVSPAIGRTGLVLTVAICLAFGAITVDVDLSPRLQRGDWRGLAHALQAGASDRAITTVELGAAPLEYYLPPLHNLPRRRSISVREIDETGYEPLRHGAGRPPAPGFVMVDRRDVDGLIAYRFVSPVPRDVSEALLRRHVITSAHAEVLVPDTVRALSRLVSPPEGGANVVVR